MLTNEEHEKLVELLNNEKDVLEHLEIYEPDDFEQEDLELIDSIKGKLQQQWEQT